MPPADFNTYRGDIRPFGNGSPFAYRYDATIFVGDAQGEIAQGEMVAWDSANKRVIRFVRTGPSKFIGLSRDSAFGMKKLGNQPALTLTELSVYSTGIHLLIGKAGETYSHGDSVFMDATSTIAITKVAGGGIQIGTVHNPQNQTISGNVRVPVLIDEFTTAQA